MLTSTPALLDENRERLVASFSRDMLKDPYVEVFRRISYDELEKLLRSIVMSLSAYLDGNDGEFNRCFELVGNTCFQLSVPLLETAYALFLLREKTVDFLASGQDHDSASESDRAAKFFDRLVLELLRTY